jgi:hypothetical protein
MFATCDAVDRATDPVGFQLLLLMRSYQELDMSASLRVHTDVTLEEGRKEVERFYRELLVGDLGSNNWSA